MNRDRSTGDMLKKALDKRQTGSLPSNFSFRMMEQIRMEAAKQARRRQRMMVVALSAALSVILGLFIYFVFFYMKVGLSAWIPDLSLSSFSSPLFGFYTYIAVLTLALLGLDYWIRRKKLTSNK